MSRLNLLKKIVALLPVLVVGSLLVVYGNNCGSSPVGSATGVHGVGGVASTAAPVISMVAAGRSHACAVIGRRIQCWGLNDQSQLGNGTTVDSHTGVWVSGIDGTITALVSGQFHSCAMVDSAVQCWGSAGGFGGLGGRTTPQAVSSWGLGSGVTALVAGQDSTCVLMQGGVQCAGDNNTGKLGRLSPGNGPDWVTGLTAGAGAIKLAGGTATFCAETASSLVCWGYNYFGNLGGGFASNFSATPIVAVGLVTPLSSLMVGAHGTCATNSSGTYCWGDNTEANTLGTILNSAPVLSPALSGGLAGPGTLLNGALNTCRLGSEVLSCVGYAAYMFADGNTIPTSRDTLFPLTSLGSNVTSASFSLSNNGRFACAVKAGSSIVCWGEYNNYGQLGDGTTNPSAAPVTVQLAR